MSSRFSVAGSSPRDELEDQPAHAPNGCLDLREWIGLRVQHANSRSRIAAIRP